MNDAALIEARACPECAKLRAELEEKRVSELAELGELRAAQYVPGLYRCDECGFVQLCSTLYMKSGAIGPTITNEVKRCPNDNKAMRRMTWRERVDDADAWARSYLDRLTKRELQLSLLAERVLRNNHLDDADELKALARELKEAEA